jgi:MFS family permease
MTSPSLRRARIATTMLFGLTGFVFATWAARIPAVQHRLGLTPGSLALVLSAIEGGAVLGLPAGGALVARAGSATCLRAGFVLYPAGLAGIAVAPSLVILVPVVMVWAAANSVVDVALNVQGLELERRYGRSVLSGLHAGQSFGLLAGGLLTVAAAAARLPVPVQLAGVAGLSLAAGVVATWGLPAEAPHERARILARPSCRLLLLGAVAFCAFGLDGAANSWIAVQLRTDYGASAALAAAAYAGFVAALATGRLVGDRLLTRYDRARVVALAGSLAVVAGLLIVLPPAVPLVMTGWVFLGLAVAPLAAAVLGAAPAVAGTPAPAALAAITTLGYLGSFTGPPFVGLIAGFTTVSHALASLLLAALAVVLLARPAFRTVHPSAPRPPGTRDP